MDLYEIFRNLNIKYQEIEHKPVFTIEQAQLLNNKIYGVGCKNLFLTDKKGKYVLAILEENKKADIKQIKKITNTSKLSFTDESELEKILKLKRGCVTPFGIINDIDNKVIITIDMDLQNKQLLFHPNINTKTISIGYNDLIKFIEFEKHTYLFI